MLGLNQLPEALLPLVLFARPLDIHVIEIALVAIAFTTLDF